MLSSSKVMRHSIPEVVWQMNDSSIFAEKMFVRISKLQSNCKQGPSGLKKSAQCCSGGSTTFVCCLLMPRFSQKRGLGMQTLSKKALNPTKHFSNSGEMSSSSRNSL